MQRKLTLTMSEEVYDGLRERIPPRKISRFIEDLARPHVVREDLYEAYRAMAADSVREVESEQWADATCGDVHDEER